MDLTSPYLRETLVVPCQGQTDLMFDVDREADAKKVCGFCPYVVECLEKAILEEEEWGVWGGKTRKERLPLIRAKRKADKLAERENHGTRSRYLRGCKCVECLAATAKYVKEHRSRPTA